MTRIWRTASLLVTLALAACVTTPLPEHSTPPPDEPQTVPTIITPTGESAAFARFYRSAQTRLVARGLLRTDGGGVDTPFTAEQLAQNFERIALFDEYTLQNGRFVQRQTPATLRRWTAPVRLQPHFGASVEAGQQTQDRATLTRYAARLARLTGHPISTSGNGNYHVLFMTTDELAAAGPLVQQLVPGIGAATVRRIENMGRNTYCAVFAFSQPGSSVYTAAIAVIRAEHPSLLRRGCIQEEIAQGLGLPNDSPTARPSIFNDDEEFALLTPHDEMLLRILYDPRLAVGTTPDAARATVRMIAGELVGGPS